MENLGAVADWTLFCFRASLCHMVIFDVFRQVVFAACRINREVCVIPCSAIRRRTEVHHLVQMK